MLRNQAGGDRVFATLMPRKRHVYLDRNAVEEQSS